MKKPVKLPQPNLVEQNLNFKTPADFALEIEDLVWLHDIDYMEAVILYCEKNNMDIDTAANLISLNANFKSTIQLEAESINLLPKTARLPGF